jgi:hypothetical protein
MIITGLSTSSSIVIAEIRVSALRRKGVPYQAALSVLGGRNFVSHTFSPDLSKLKELEIDPIAYGQTLGNFLFDNAVLGIDYRETLAVIESHNEHLHVRLVIEPAELQRVHWERIFQPVDNGWLALGSTTGTPLSRWVTPKQWSRPKPVAQRPLRMLVVIASPSDLAGVYHLDPISIDEQKRLHLNLSGLRDVNITYLESGSAHPPTIENIRQALAEGYNIIHFLCHGAITDGGTVLYLENDQGKSDPVLSQKVINAFKVLSPPPTFCFLSACESATRDRHDAFLPLGLTLVEQGGVPAVIAMSGKVGINTAQLFVSQFYARLLAHGFVDQAANEARHLVQDHWDWGAPVLYSMIEGNQLLDFPISAFYERSLAHNDRAYLAAHQLLDNAQARQLGSQAVVDIENLIAELSKSHKFLADLASDFRDVGSDPATFNQNFTNFYLGFKRRYDGHTWVQDKTSCHEVDRLSHQIITDVGPNLDEELKKRLELELVELGDNDEDLMQIFQQFLDQMDNVVESIWKQLRQTHVEAAIRQKDDFDAQISSSLRRSRSMLEKMSERVGNTMRV